MKMKEEDFRDRSSKRLFADAAKDDGVSPLAKGPKLILVNNPKPPRGPNKLELRAQFSNLVEEDGKLPQGVEPYMNKADDNKRTNLGPDARHAQ